MTTSLAPVPSPIDPFKGVPLVPVVLSELEQSRYARRDIDSYARCVADAMLDHRSPDYYLTRYALLVAFVDALHASWDAVDAAEDPWAVPAGFESPDPIVAIDWTSITTDYGRAAAVVHTPSGVVELGPEDFGPLELPTRCDSEKGWAECECGIIWHFKSHCSLPLELWSDNGCDPAAGTHDIGYIELLEDCHCGSFDPAIEHPCIGHDRATGLPLEGPSMFWKYWEIRQGICRG